VINIEIKKIKVSQLKEAPYNPRTISDAELNKLKNSINKFGYVEPIIYNKQTGNTVGGNQRLKALKALKIEEVPVVEVDMPLEKEKSLNIALNKISGQWDEQKLHEVLTELQDIDVELVNLSGYNQDELNELILFIDNAYKRGTFDNIVDEYSNTKGMSTKNQNWFYIEYYQEDKKFEQLCKVLEDKFKGKSTHELDPTFFYNLIMENAKRK